MDLVIRCEKPEPQTMLLRPTAVAGLILVSAIGVAGSAHMANPPAINRVVPLSEGRRIALHCEGRGKFTVLLEPGDGGRRAHMAKLFEALSAKYRVCAYDRRNVGQSSAAPLPRKAAELTADAFDALAAAGEKGPYILFGTSMGGLLVRNFAATRQIAGFVTSNQPGTAAEFAKWVTPLMSPAERAADAAWAAGDNNEHFDVNDLSRAIDASQGALLPHIIMISTERFQCPAAGACGSGYVAFVAASRATAEAGIGGRLEVLDGDHDLYVTNLPDVVKAVDEVASAASRGA